jgi:adenylate kinase
MLNIVIFGAPGAGKGTQSEYIVKNYQLVHLSTGDIFRYNIKQETELGKKAKTYIDQGILVPDELTIQMLEDEVDKHQNIKGIIFDGFPRTSEQANSLDLFLAKKNTKIHAVLGIEVPETELIHRLILRGQISGRVDDANVGVIEGRIREYTKKTAPLKAYYQDKKLYYSIDGLGEIDQIQERISKVIHQKLSMTSH